METALSFSNQGKIIYNDRTRFMVSLGGSDSYFNNWGIQTRDVILMNTAYYSSGSIEPRVRSEYIGHSPQLLYIHGIITLND